MKKILFLTLLFTSPSLMAAENLLTPDSEAQLKIALNDLYKIDFKKANIDLSKIIQAEPNNPFAYLSDAGALWWETSAHYGLIPTPAWLKSRFEEDLARAISGAKKLLESDSPKDQAEGHFIMGLSLGELGEWDFLNHHWLKAFFNGKKALSHLKTCLKIDSTYYDAYLGLGSYDYQVSRFGFLLKAGALLGGLHANAQRGIEHLIMAEDRGRYSSEQAAIFLATLYTLDKKDYKTALSIIQKLRQEYPNSFYFELIEIGLRDKLNEWNRSLSLGVDALSKIKAHPNAYKDRLLDTACGFSPQNCLDPQESSEIVDWTSRAIAATKNAGNKNDDPDMLSLLHLYRGYGEDLTGLRDNAENDYQWVLNHPDFLENHAQASECLKTPCTRETVIRLLQFKSPHSSSTKNP